MFGDKSGHRFAVVTYCARLAHGPISCIMDKRWMAACTDARPTRQCRVHWRSCTKTTISKEGLAP